MFEEIIVEAGAYVQKPPRSWRERLARILQKSSPEFTPARLFKAGEPSLEDAFAVARQLTAAGVLKRIRVNEPLPDSPKFFGYTTDGAGGIDFFSKEKALWAAVAERLERHIWRESTDYFRKPRTLSIREALRKGALDPDLVVGHTRQDRAAHPYLSYSPDSTFLWAEAWSYADNKRKLIPAQLFSRAWFRAAVEEKKQEPIIRELVSTGLAAGQTFEEAVLRGFLEVIERDAFMVSYLNELTLPRLDLERLAEDDHELRKVLASFDRYLLEPHAVLLLSDFGIPVVWGILLDRTGKGPAVCVGAKASFSLREALLGALSESLAVHIGERWRKKTELPEKTRFGRESRLVWWALPEQLPRIEPFLKGPVVVPAAEKELQTLERASAQERLSYVIERCRAKGYDALAVDMSRAECNTTNIKVAFTLIPQLQPLHLNERHPFFEGERLSSVPKQFGYEPRKETFKEPHPFP